MYIENTPTYFSNPTTFWSAELGYIGTTAVYAPFTHYNRPSNACGGLGLNFSNEA